jgi:predicted DNA-binding protein (UPF0251 family)
MQQIETVVYTLYELELLKLSDTEQLWVKKAKDKSGKGRVSRFRYGVHRLLARLRTFLNACCVPRPYLVHIHLRHK